MTTKGNYESKPESKSVGEGLDFSVGESEAIWLRTGYAHSIHENIFKNSHEVRW